MLEETKRYKEVGTGEILQALISAIAIGFTLSFRDWGQTELDVSAGLEALLLTTIIALAIILLRIVAVKFIALRYGYYTTYTIHKYGLPVSLFVTFFLAGTVPYVAPGQMHFKESKRLRLGSFRGGYNLIDTSLSSLAAPISCVLLMLLIKPLFLITGHYFIRKIIQVAAAITIGGLIPIQGSEGFHLLFYRRWIWVVSIVFVLVYFGLILAAGVFSYVIAGILALAALWIYQAHYN